jgi:hypothetical protein
VSDEDQKENNDEGQNGLQGNNPIHPHRKEKEREERKKEKRKKKTHLEVQH